MLRERADVTYQYAPAYRASVTDTDAKIQRLTELLKQGTGSWDAIRVRLKALSKECWPAALTERYRQSTRLGDRFDGVTAASREARDSESARLLGVLALKDRSYVVRGRAHMLLAYSLNAAAIPALREALATEQRPQMQRSLDNAIHAIERRDHTRYIDRTDRPGSSHLGVHPWDTGDLALIPMYMGWEIDPIHKGWAEGV